MEKLNQFSQTICVAKDVRLITYPLDSKDIGRRLKTLLDSPASVNILLVTSDTARLAISELLKWNQTDLDRFLWIGTNGFISTFKDLYLTDYLNPTSEKYFHGFKKFILVLPHLTEVENMKNYSINLKRTFNLTSWTSTYLLQFCGCLLNEVDLHNSTGQVCNINDEHKCISYLYGDSIYYVPQVVNAVYAIANALRQIFIQYPMLKWHHTSSEQMRRLLLNKLQKSQFEGFGKELFTFYDKRNGQPNFTILTFVSSELKWKVLGQYDASRSPSFYYINENISSYIYETIPESVCSKPCKSGQIKRIDWGRSCCWICINCSSQQIVTSENTETTHNKTENDIYKNHSSLPMCQFCNPGYRPNKNQTKCQMLPIKYMSIYEKVAQSSVGISSIGLTLCLIVSIICIKYWQTPIVKASGKETSIILFLGIILSYISGELILALSPSVFICNFSIFSVGFCITLTYSAIFARSSRINAIFQVYIILFRPYKNTRASIMQRLRGLSQVECMEWINEVKSRSPPGIFSISKGKVSTPWLKIHELSSKSLGAPTSTVPNPTILNKKTSKPIEKCLINEFSCGTSVITYDYTKASDKQVHENNSSSFRMKPKIVPFTENLNLDETNKVSFFTK
ncbi:Metabotropic glutamate receptor 7 isoform 1 [Schistosoma japonicum]|uniref:Metabotropic glutamate receptor 7 isoform 1 n=1 Tax=Schistosoma japonicum TaxID=6182 RepID=A0A4Z2D6D1_SCHJA|nr:Metabotropic glutamate receptor 7 isoform 1 [Schistosoma japonicum]